MSGSGRARAWALPSRQGQGPGRAGLPGSAFNQFILKNINFTQNSGNLTFMHRAKILKNINKGTRDNENIAKKIICICDLIFLLKIFQSNANFLKENHISRALWAPGLLTTGSGRARAWALLPMSGLGLSKNPGLRAGPGPGLGPDPSLGLT